MNKCTVFLLGLFVFFLSCVSSHATTFTIEMGDESWIDVSDTSDGLIMWATIYSSVSEVSFSLDVGESYTFLYAMMGTTEDWINDDDLVAQDVTAYLDFDEPEATGAVSGETVGFSGLLEYNQGWTIEWDDAIYLTLDDGTVFKIELSDAGFSSGFWTGPDGLCGNAYADIFATITLISEGTEPVPEPATLLLLGTGLAGFAGLKRKKRS